jgi:hypothetical protein
MKNYIKKAVQPMEAWHFHSDMHGVSVSDPDKQNGSPKIGDMIAHSPTNPDDRWLVAKKFFNDNYIEA